MFEQKPITHPHHVRLYVVMGLVVLLGVSYLLFSKGERAADTTLLEAQTVTLTPEQLQERDAVLRDPALSWQILLDEREVESQRKIMEEAEVLNKNK